MRRSKAKLIRLMIFGFVLGGLTSLDASPQTGADQSKRQPESQTKNQSVQLVNARPIELATKHLPNAVRVHPKVVSGGMPEGEAAFAELVSLGFKTIISVDGVKPDVTLAKAHGLRYVHLPHGYSGIPEDRVHALAKAMRELNGPIYVHCHHGKHRSPAAASVACVAAGIIPPAMGVEVLKVAGTSPGYRGLFRAAAEARPIDADTLAKSDAEFPEVASIPPMAQAMVRLEQCQQQLQLAADAGWSSPPDHPDIDPQHQALLLREHFTELLRTDEVQQHESDFRTWIADSEHYAKRIESALRVWKRSADHSPPTTLAESLRGISRNCTACHVRYRDNAAAN